MSLSNVVNLWIIKLFDFLGANQVYQHGKKSLKKKSPPYMNYTYKERKRKGETNDNRRI